MCQHRPGISQNQRSISHHAARSRPDRARPDALGKRSPDGLANSLGSCLGSRHFDRLRDRDDRRLPDCLPDCCLDRLRYRRPKRREDCGPNRRDDRQRRASEDHLGGHPRNGVGVNPTLWILRNLNTYPNTPATVSCDETNPHCEAKPSPPGFRAEPSSERPPRFLSKTNAPRWRDRNTDARPVQTGESA